MIRVVSVVDADDAMRYDLTLDRIEDGTTNDVQARHCHLLACVLCAFNIETLSRGRHKLKPERLVARDNTAHRWRREMRPTD